MDSILDVCSDLYLGDGALRADFIGKGNIWINNTYEPSVIGLARYIISEAIMQTAPGQLSVLGYDRDLTGVFAPFASLSAGEGKVLELITDEKGFRDQLVYLRQQIQDVQNVVQGRSESLLQFRAAMQRPVEGYKLIVLSLDMGLISQETRAQLSLLMRSGPAFGISFLIISTTFMSIQTAAGKDLELSVQSIAQNITVLESYGSTVAIEGVGNTRLTAPSAEQIIDECDRFTERLRTAKLPVVLFKELHDTANFWTESSTDGLTFSVGKYGVNDMRITIGDEINQRHNAIITGAVGQGKSNLISVIIHSLCTRYSPRELQMYLLDFKEGVTFKPFSDIGQKEYLPHAKALGLESDVSFGMAVLDSLFKEYLRRMKLLKEKNCKSIRELRMRFPEYSMPRIVTVIDEFQMMFGDDMQTGMKVAEMLEKSVRLFRAAGIHFILASQTLGGNMALAQKRDSIFSQVPIRIALKNSVSESQQTLSMNNPAAAFLRPREAVVNLDYGEISQNRKTVVAFADENVLIPLRQQWWARAKDEFPAPYVFESERRITVSSGMDEIRSLQSRHSAPCAVVGDKISIDGERVVLPLSEEPGRNIAIIGTPDSECHQAAGIMQSIAVSLALQHPDGHARFLFCDFEHAGKNYAELYPAFERVMQNTSCRIEYIAPAQFEETVRTFTEQGVSEDPVYIFGAAMDRWEYEKDPYGGGSSLKTFVERAPSKRMHFIGWWIKASGFTEQVAGFGSSDAFNSKIFLRLDERAVQSLTNPFVHWSAQNNRALMSDSVEFADEFTFIPYAPVTDADAQAIH